MIPFNQFSHPINMKGISGKLSLWFRFKMRVGEFISYRVSFWYQDQDWLHPTRVFEKILHILKWVPLLWRDHDWDQGYLYNVMAFKLKMMEVHHREDKVIGDWKKVADEIKIARECLDRIAADDYCKKEHKDHRRKFPSKKRWDAMRKSKPDKNGCKVMPSMSDEELESFVALMDKEEKAKQADFALFCKTFTECSRGWWS